MYYYNNLVIDLSGKDNPPVITAKQHDLKSRYLTVNIVADAIGMDLSNITSAELRVLDPYNYRHIATATSITQYQIEFDISDVIVTAGKNIAEIVLYENNVIISSSIFILQVVGDTTPGNYMTEETARTEFAKGFRRVPTLIRSYTNTSAISDFVIDRDNDGLPFEIRNSFTVYIHNITGASSQINLELQQDGQRVTILNGAIPTAARWYRSDLWYNGAEWAANCMVAAANVGTMSNLQTKYARYGFNENSLTALHFGANYTIPAGTLFEIYGENYAGLG